MPGVRKDEKEASFLTALADIHCQSDITVLLLDGKSVADINKYVQDKYGLSEHIAGLRIIDARHAIRDRQKYEVNNMVSIHLARYERMYEDMMRLRLFNLAQTALQSKEKLLGFHRDDFHMKISSGQTTEISFRHVVNEFNLDKLEGEKRDRLTHLLQKAQRQAIK